MTPAEAAKVLAVAAIYDRRTVGETDALAWADALNDLEPRDCAEAVRTHYRTNTAWCMPAHVRVIVAGQRREAARRRQTGRVFAALEQAKADATTDGAAECRRAFEEAIEEARASRPAPAPTPAVGSAAPVENGVRA